MKGVIEIQVMGKSLLDDDEVHFKRITIDNIVTKDLVRLYDDLVDTTRFTKDFIEKPEGETNDSKPES